VDHTTADAWGIPISRRHPSAGMYNDGFIQPAVIVTRGDEPVFTFIQKPKMTNLWGAARRPEPKQVLEALRVELSSAGN
jgi:hypothetical protein